MDRNTILMHNRQFVINLLLQPHMRPQVIASQYYTLVTGHELHTETDLGNGEYYLYKAPSYCDSTSVHVHPEVAEFFHWRCQALSSSNRHTFYDKLFTCSLTNMEMAKVFNENMLDYLLIEKK